MITKLELKNWRTHKETTLEFSEGTNVIVGVMGSGKSSIVNAVSYALFGTFPGIKNRAVSLKEIIMNKPNQCTESIVKAEFEKDGKKFLVERRICLDETNEAKLFEEGKLISGPKQKDVNEKIEAILGLSYELFSRAVYAEQNEMDFFLKLSPSERKKKFDELLEIEKYEEARKNAVSLQNTFVKDGKEKRDFVERQKATLKGNEEEKLIQKIKEDRKEILLLEKKIEELGTGYEKKKKEFEVIEKKEKDYLELNEVIVKGKSKLEIIKEDLSKGSTVDIKEIEEKLKTLKKLDAGVREEKKDKEKEEKEVQEKKNILMEEMKVIEYQLREFEKEEKNIGLLKGNCPTCKQEMNEEHRGKLLKEISQKKEKAEEIITKQKKEALKMLDTLSGVEKRMKEIEKTVDENRKTTYEIEGILSQSQKAEGKKKEMEKLEKELPTLEEKLKEIRFDKKILDKAREELFGIKNEKNLCEEKTRSKKEIIKSYEQTLEKINQAKKNINEIEEEEKIIVEAGKKMGVFSNCLIATQNELRETLLSTINTAMTTIWQSVYPYKDFLDAKLFVVENGYDLKVLTRGNEWVRVEGILSGGERSAAALCIRMAFALVLTKQLSMLILDEPTHNLDRNAVEKLSEMLREEMPKLVSQIFVITHDKELENAASADTYILDRNKDADEPTRVEKMLVE